MPSDWRKHLQRHPRVKALEGIRSRRHHELRRDPMFALKTGVLKRRLERCYSQNPKTVREFFRRFSWPVAAKLRERRRFLQKIENRELRRTLRQYAKYASRFRVIFVLRKHTPFRDARTHARRVEISNEGGRWTALTFRKALGRRRRTIHRRFVRNRTRGCAIAAS